MTLVPQAMPLSGAFLFVDLSGFTALTEALTGQGPQGLEAVMALLERIFAPVVDEISIHGGDVVYYAGDALLACWEAEAETALVAVARAHACGRAILALPLEGGLTLHLGLSAGAANVLIVGGVERRWKMLLAGPALAELGPVVHDAQSGELVLTPYAAQLLAAQSTSPLVRPAPSQIEIDPELSLPFLTRSLAAMIDAGLGSWAAELRQVAVAFIALADAEQAAQLALDELQQVVTLVQQHTYAADGSIYQLLVDDKGLVAIIVFGMPPFFHDDDAERCIQSCQALHQALAGRGLRCPTGIAAGRVFVGERGGARRREYALLGDVLNTAARLMQAASHPDQPALLCDQRVVERARHHLAFRELAPLALKGKRQRQPVFTPTTGLPAQAVEFVGRQAERTLILELLDGLRHAGRAGALVLEGEAGIGKSLLLQLAQEQAAALGVRVLAGQGSSLATTTPYYPWMQVLLQLLALPQTPRPQQLYSALSAAGESPDLAPLLNPLTLLTLPDTPATAPLAGRARAEALRALCLRLLAHHAALPTLLTLEDAHWFDSESLALARLAAAEGHLLLVLTSRPPRSPIPEYAALCLHPTTVVRRLEALTREEMDALLARRLGAPLPAPALELIWERAHGHSLFSEELAYALRDAGQLAIVDGRCLLATDAGALRSVPLPDRLQGVIGSRIDRLTPVHQLTLKVASVIGQTFELELLHQAHPLRPSEDQLAEALAELELHDFLVAEEQDRFSFRHALIQDAAYKLMLVSQRSAIHRRIGALLEDRALYAPTSYSILGLHFWSGEDWARAAQYCGHAAEDAVRAFAYAEGRRLYSRAIEALTRLPSTAQRSYQRADLQIKYVSVALVAESPSANLARLQDAERLLTEPHHGQQADGQRLAAMRYALGRSYYYYTRPEQALAQFQQMEQLALGLGDEALLAVARSMIGRVRSLQGFFAEALPLIEAAQPTLATHDNWTDWIWNQGYCGFCQVTLGEPAGVAAAREALEVATRRSHSTGMAVSAIFLTMIGWMAGDLDACLAAGATTIDLATRTGDLMPLHLAHGFRAWALGRAGHHEQAAEDLAHYEAIVAQLGGRLVYADWFAACRAELALLRGDWRAAEHAAEQAISFAEEIDGIFAAGSAHRVLAEALAAQGRWAAVWPELERSSALLIRCAALPELARTEAAEQRLRAMVASVRPDS